MSMRVSRVRSCDALRPLLALAACALVITLARFTMAQSEPSHEPILQLEMGMHTNTIRQIGVDAGNRFLVTASDDKTVRVWEFPSGRLLRTIRVPINPGYDGRLFSVALSPDGTTIAAGGWTSPSGFNTNIYLFDRESGRLIRRLSELPTLVQHLVYSPDGRYLAATMGGKSGVRVYQTRDYALVGEDTEYGGQTYGADFDHADRLVTMCQDGFVRLYAPLNGGTLEFLTKQKVNGDGASSVSFSPDGSRIAVGFDSWKRVTVLSGRDLSALYEPNTGPIYKGTLTNVAWSADGRTLFAGGNAHDANKGPLIAAWADGGRGEYRDLTGVVAANTIFQILPLRDGGIVYCAGDPAFGAIDASGRKVLFRTAPIADLRDVGEGFVITPDGTGIGFAYQRFRNLPARFSVVNRRLDTAPDAALNWRPPISESPGLEITGLDTYAPSINGTRLALDPSEMTWSHAITPDASAVLLGTSFNVRLFNSHGVELWKFANADVPWALNISANGKLAVVGNGDGTIRWYRMTDGKELLAFFPHADRKRWVLWTPSGYYDASAGGEELIGWHVNNSRDQAADFFPVGQFRSTYYRPDVISRILETGDEAEALKLANEERGRKGQTTTVAQMLPPVVEIASPADNSTNSAAEVTIRYLLRTPSGEAVTNVRILVDGRPVVGSRQLIREEPSASGAREVKVAVPDHDTDVSIVAENRFAASVPATIRLKWRGATPAADAFVIQPKLYVLAIGVSQYQNASYSLKFAAKDARDFAAAATLQKGFLYRDVVVKVLTDAQATKDEVLDGLDWIRKQTTSKDVAMVFFAGHGLNDQNGVYYFLPFNTDLEKLLRTGVPFTDIKNTVQSLPGKTLLFIDTCHSGNVLGGRRGLVEDLNGVINELASAESGAVVFAASTGNQSSFEDAKWNNGAFTKALVEGITGRADYTGKGKITINMLDLYLSERVKELTGGKQTPTTAKPNTIQDYPIAVKH